MNSPIRGSWRRQLLASVLMLGGAIAFSGNRALAQSNIVPDATLSAESSVVVPNFNGLAVEAIAGGAQRGQNLFHSFVEFNVSEGRGAYFFSPDAAIGNILARVTGANRSDILGVLGTFGNSGPNLFLINPNGIIFGPNAQLDVGGSFVASTANSVVFGNGYQFSATNPQAPPLLTINVPLGLQYGATPGRIVNQSIANGNGLQVQPGRTLGLVGGDVDLEGGILSAPDGRIELGSVAGNSLVNLTPTTTGYTLGYNGVENFQDIRLTQRAFVLTNGNGGGGDIQVQGRNLTLTDGSAIFTMISGPGKGGSLIINASSGVQLIGTSADGLPSILGATAESTATGEAGDIRITTPTLLVRDGARIDASTLGAAKGGNLIVNASQEVQVIGTSADGRLTSGLSAITSRTGDAGEIKITTPVLVLKDGARISTGTSGAGKGGNVIIHASDSVQVIGTSADGRYNSGLSISTFGTGDAGELTITTGQLLLRDGAGINADTGSAGKGGSLIINASQGVQVIGRSADGRISSNLSTSSASGTGNAGEMRITTGQLQVRDGAMVAAISLGAGKGGNLIINASDSVQLVGGDLSAYTFGTGDAGEMKITTGQLLLKDGASVNADTLGAGKGGSLTIEASQGVQVIGSSANGQYGSNLSTSSFATGDAGEMRITTRQLLISDGAQISADTLGAGKGGSVIINASQGVQVIGRSADGRYSSSLSSLTLGTGAAGEMRITTGQLLIKDGAYVSADTLGAGKGGNLTVNASQGVQVIGRSADGEFGTSLSAESNENATGDAGNLIITTPRLLISDGAQVSASTFGAGKGGNLTVDASQEVQVIGRSADGWFGTFLTTQAAPNATGDAGNLTITTPRLLILGGAQVDAGTFGAGKGGNLTVNASNSVQVIGRSADERFGSNLSTQAQGTGIAGDLSITTPRLLILGGAKVSASTFGAGKGGNLTVDASQEVQVMGESADGQFGSSLSAFTEGTGNAGDLTITTPRLLVTDGAQVDAGTGSTGRGGNLTVIASEDVQLIGTSADGQFPSGLFVSATSVDGIAGNLSVTTRQMSVRDGAKVNVSSPEGQAGNMTITAEDLTLNRGKLTAETAESGIEGGANIFLQRLDLLRMDNESLISATAFEDANGGNVTIDSTFIVATPPKGPEGSDIIANAFQGNGGRVNITTQGLFGIEFRPQRTPLNDITVSSIYGIAGIAEINTPGVDPSRGLAELPTDVVDASQQIDRRCTPSAGSSQGSSFTITGRGGLPPSPNEVLQGEFVMVDWVTLDPTSDKGSRKDNSMNSTASTSPTAPHRSTLTEAQSWMYGANGEVILTATAPNVTPHSPMPTPATCPSL
jgi:filamentous hemagglutinin family protein